MKKFKLFGLEISIGKKEESKKIEPNIDPKTPLEIAYEKQLMKEYKVFQRKFIKDICDRGNHLEINGNRIHRDDHSYLGYDTLTDSEGIKRLIEMLKLFQKENNCNVRIHFANYGEGDNKLRAIEYIDILNNSNKVTNDPINTEQPVGDSLDF